MHYWLDFLSLYSALESKLDIFFCFWWVALLTPERDFQRCLWFLKTQPHAGHP